MLTADGLAFTVKNCQLEEVDSKEKYLRELINNIKWEGGEQNKKVNTVLKVMRKNLKWFRI